MQHRVPVKCAPRNNGYMIMVRQWPDLHHGARDGHGFPAPLPPIVALARAFGWQVRMVSDPAERNAVLSSFLATDGSSLLDITVVVQDNCLPMVAAASGHGRATLGASMTRGPGDRSVEKILRPQRPGLGQCDNGLRVPRREASDGCSLRSANDTRRYAQRERGIGTTFAVPQAAMLFSNKDLDSCDGDTPRTADRV